MARRPEHEKLRRIRSGERPVVLDLFSGAGGLSLGFEAAGFAVLGGIDNDPSAVDTYRFNLRAGALQEDIRTVDPLEAVARLAANGSGRVDVIAAGSPCQPFSRIGRAKLWSLAGASAHLQDPRAGLYGEVLRYVAALRPVAVVAENVPDVLDHGGVNMPEELALGLERMGFTAAYALLDAAWFGVPQHRQRVILVAIHEAVGCDVVFPAPSRSTQAPPGYWQAIARASRLAAREGGPAHYVQVRAREKGLPRAVTASEAIGDLPAVPRDRDLTGPRGYRSVPYQAGPGSEYAWLMRNWPGHVGLRVVDHLTRRYPRDEATFALMKPGDEYPEALRLADRRFRLALAAKRRWGNVLVEGSEGWQELRRRFVPPYPVGSFPNRWWKMIPDAPSRTLTAHLGRDCYSHIHYDDRQARPITVREAARLQSFPDGFMLPGSMNAAYRLIGNAVPPLLARAVARVLLDLLRGDVRRDDGYHAARKAVTPDGTYPVERYGAGAGSRARAERARGELRKER